VRAAGVSRSVEHEVAGKFAGQRSHPGKSCKIDDVGRRALQFGQKTPFSLLIIRLAGVFRVHCDPPLHAASLTELKGLSRFSNSARQAFRPPGLYLASRAPRLAQ